MYAIFETGGKQYKAEKGTVLFVEKLDAAENEVVNFDKVLLLDDDKETKVGAPYLSSILVAAKVLKQGKDKKITVFTYKAKKNEKRKLGHRQPYTKLEVVGIGSEADVKKQADEAAKAPKAAAKAEKAEKTEVAEKTEAKAAEKKPAAKKTAAKATAAKAADGEKAAAKKPAAKKATTAKKTTTAAKKPAAKKPAAKKTEAKDAE